jgi:serine/threonine protein kinase
MKEDPKSPKSPSSSKSSLKLLDEKSIKIGEKLSEGNFGIVYKGQLLYTTVAIKQLKGDQSEFEKEIEFVASLPPHPNIVTFMGACKHSALGLLMVMEWMEGGSLLSILQQNTLKPDQKRECCLQICLGLEYLHANDVIHRDLAARNVVVILQISKTKIISAFFKRLEVFAFKID